MYHLQEHPTVTTNTRAPQQHMSAPYQLVICKFSHNLEELSDQIMPSGGKDIDKYLVGPWEVLRASGLSHGSALLGIRSWRQSQKIIRKNPSAKIYIFLSMLCS